MATTEILPFATNDSGSGGNVLSPAAYAALTTLLADGFQAGTALSVQINTVLRQSSFMSAALAHFVVNQGISQPDDGNLTQAALNIEDAINALIAAANNGAFSTGDYKMTIKTAADAGWVMCNDGTIGSAASGGTTRANADTVNLYTLMWNNISDTWAPVSGGRGGSAAADFAANKPIALTKMLGRALAIGGTGASLSARALGQTLGEENHQLTTAELATHTHPNTLSDPGHVHSVITHDGTGALSGGRPLGFSAGGVNESPNGGAATTNVTSVSITNNSQGSNTPHNIMQPSTFVNIMLKL